MYWTITNTELSAEGNGQCQLTATEDDVVVKSIIYDTLIGPALDGNGEVPEPWEDWRQDFVDMANEAKTAATQAETAATNAAQSADDAADSARAASDIADEIKELTAEAETLSSGSSATADYDAETGVLSIGVPVGDNGAPGISPTITITDITGGHRVTITDADGAHSFDVMDGDDGVGIPTGGTTGQVLSKASGTDYDTEWTTPSGGDVTDVQVNGTSVVSGGVANVPAGSVNVFGVYKLGPNAYGLEISDEQRLSIIEANDTQIRDPASNVKRPIIPYNQHKSAFYGLAKAAGADMKNVSATVGVYPEAQKSAISQMLNSPVTVSGSTPTITALPGVQYECGEVSTLDIILPNSGIVDVTFTSGSTPTALTINAPTGMTVEWDDDFDSTALDADTTYEVNFKMTGTKCLGVAGQWT